MAESNTLSVSWVICELRLLDRLLYKQRNQHHKGNYFHKLLAVKQQTRQLLQLAQAQQARQTTTFSLHHSPSLSQLKLSEDTFHSIVTDRRTGAALQSRQELAQHLVHCQHAIIKASAVLYALLSQTYFMSFALTALAIIARLYSSQRALLAQLLDACAAQVRSNRAQKQKQKQQSDSAVDISSQSSALDPSHMLADSLLRAMRSDREREWIERCDGAQLFLPLNRLPCANAARTACLQLLLGPDANSANDPQSVSRLLSHSKHSAAASDNEGDSDEDEGADEMDEDSDDEEGNTAPAVSTPKNSKPAAALPSALSFFSPAASLKQSAATKTKIKPPAASSSSSTAFQTPAKTGNVSKGAQKMEVDDDDDEDEDEEGANEDVDDVDDQANESADEDHNEDEADDDAGSSDDDDAEDDEGKPHSVTPTQQKPKSLVSTNAKQPLNSSSALKKVAPQKQSSLAAPHTIKNIGQKRKDVPLATSISPQLSPAQQSQQPSKQQLRQTQQQPPPSKKTKLSPAITSSKKLTPSSPQPPGLMSKKPLPSQLSSNLISAKKNPATSNPLAVLTGVPQKLKPSVAAGGTINGNKQQLSKLKKVSKSDVDEMDDIFG